MSPLELPTDIFHKYAYNPSNEHYQKLFREASERATRSNVNGAGWLVSNNPTECDVVLFVAHSVRSAIQLLRKTLPPSTLSNENWVALDRAARSLEQNPADTDVPPSAQRPRSPLPSSSSPSTGQTPSPRSELDDIQNPRSTPSEPDTSQKELGETRTTTGRNNNRRAEESRGVKRKRSSANSIGLIRPLKEASAAEHAAYKLLLRKDAPTISWIFKQKVDDDGTDFYYGSSIPYVTARAMLQNALRVGSQAARSDAASFLKSWRSLGTPFPTSTSANAPPGPIRRTLPWLGLSQPSTFNCTFRNVWNAVNFLEYQLAAGHIQRRWVMALLGREYAKKIAELQQQDEKAGRGQRRGRDGKGKLLTEAINALLPHVFSKATDKNRRNFSKRLNRALRWYNAATELGWGILCLMPHEHITNSWVERTLHAGEWHIWLELVKKVNPCACAASKAFDSWLDSESIAGGSIEGKDVLRIEAESYEVEEVLDSEDDDCDDDDDDGQSQAIPSTASGRRWRQLTLPELFSPS